MEKKKIEEINAELVSLKYVLKVGDVKICVEKDCRSNNITVYRFDYFNQPLVFKESTPEICRAIGELLIGASKL